MRHIETHCRQKGNVILSLDLKALKFFTTAADTLNFTRAAEQLSVPKSVVSKSINKLESELGLKLFERSSRVVRLTEAGKILNRRASTLLDEATHIINDMQHMQVSVSGQLRLAAPPALGRFISQEIIPEFLAQWPEVSISLRLSYDYENLFKEGLDLAFRMGINRDDNLIEKPLGAANRVIVASANYLQKHKEISNPDDLKGHKCLQIFDDKTTSWFLKKEHKQCNINLPVMFQCSDMEALKASLLQGIGIAQLPWLVVRDEVAAGKLCHVLPEWTNNSLPISVVYRYGLNKPPKLAKFLENIFEKKALFNLQAPILKEK